MSHIKKVTEHVGKHWHGAEIVVEWDEWTVDPEELGWSMAIDYQPSYAPTITRLVGFQSAETWDLLKCWIVAVR